LGIRVEAQRLRIISEDRPSTDDAVFSELDIIDDLGVGQDPASGADLRLRSNDCISPDGNAGGRA